MLRLRRRKQHTQVGWPNVSHTMNSSVRPVQPQADRYVEVGGMPARAAEGLRVPVARLQALHFFVEV